MGEIKELRKTSDKVHWIALEDLDFGWNLLDVQKVLEMAKELRYIKDIAKEVNRPIDEVTILIIDLGRKGMI